MTARPILPALAAVVLAACATPAPQAGSGADPQVDPARMNEHVRVLASDEFEGRGPTTEGERRTIDYIAARFAEMGLEPAGPDGSWFQPVPINRFTQDGPATIVARHGDWSRALERGPDILVGSHRLDPRITLEDAPLVFAGFGVTAPERDWDDFKDVDVTGAIIVVLVNDPDFGLAEGHPTAGLFEGRAMTFYGRWVYKFQEAARRGAAGVLVVHETEAAGYPWSTLQNSSTAPELDIVRADTNAERVPVQGWIQRAQAEALLARAGLDYDELKARAQQRDFRPVRLEGVTLSVDFAQRAERVITHNVAARVRGEARPGETVMYGAHWDAHGRATPNAAGDDVYNGAVDNASGVAGLLELARLFAEGPRPERSVLFMAWAAEEAGLLGANHYAVDPLAPLETTVLNLNMDSLLPGPAEPQVPVIGFGRVDAQAILARHAAAQGRTLVADPAPQVGAYYRSDHFPLALRGVPALFAAAGFTGASEASRAYVRDRYHQPTDEWDAGWSLEGAAEDVQLLYAVGRELADSDVWPAWREGDEFAAAREASAAARR